MNIRERCAALCAGWEKCRCGNGFPRVCLPDVDGRRTMGAGSNLAPFSFADFSATCYRGRARREHPRNTTGAQTDAGKSAAVCRDAGGAASDQRH